MIDWLINWLRLIDWWDWLIDTSFFHSIFWHTKLSLWYKSNTEIVYIKSNIPGLSCTEFSVFTASVTIGTTAGGDEVRGWPLELFGSFFPLWGPVGLTALDDTWSPITEYIYRHCHLLPHYSSQLSSCSTTCLNPPSAWHSWPPAVDRLIYDRTWNCHVPLSVSVQMSEFITAQREWVRHHSPVQMSPSQPSESAFLNPQYSW